MTRKTIICVIAAVALAGLLCSCQKQQSELKISNVKETAQVIGKVTYNIGYKDGNYNTYVPAKNVTVIARIPYTQYSGSSATGNYTVKANTDASGNYTLTIPVGVKTISGTVTVQPFKADKYQQVGTETKTISNALYNNSTVLNFSVSSGQVVRCNLQVTSSDVYEE